MLFAFNLPRYVTLAKVYKDNSALTKIGNWKKEGLYRSPERAEKAAGVLGSHFGNHWDTRKITFHQIYMSLKLR